MADTTCPVCGENGLLLSDHTLAWYRCTSCRHKYEVNHRTCRYPSCAAWIDDEELGLCHYHIALSGQKQDPDFCTVPGCEAPTMGNGRCRSHINDADLKEARNATPKEPVSATRACNPTFPTSDEGERRSSRSPSGVGDGQHEPRKPRGPLQHLGPGGYPETIHRREEDELDTDEGSREEEAAVTDPDEDVSDDELREFVESIVTVEEVFEVEYTDEYDEDDEEYQGEESWP